jgi:hypothetical protein
MSTPVRSTITFVNVIGTSYWTRRCFFWFVGVQPSFIADPASPCCSSAPLLRAARLGRVPGMAPVGSCPVKSFGIMANEPWGSAVGENLFSDNKVF